VRDENGLWAWELVQAAGHLDCFGWHYDLFTDRLWCKCGAPFYQSAMELAI
jgi:hypothetical protein